MAARGKGAEEGRRLSKVLRITQWQHQWVQAVIKPTTSMGEQQVHRGRNQSEAILAWKGSQFSYQFQANHSGTCGIRISLTLLGVSPAQRRSWSFGAGSAEFPCGTLTCSSSSPGALHWQLTWEIILQGFPLEHSQRTWHCWDNTHSEFSESSHFTSSSREEKLPAVTFSMPALVIEIRNIWNKEYLPTTAWAPQDFRFTFLSSSGLQIYIFLFQLESYALGKTSLKWNKTFPENPTVMTDKNLESKVAKFWRKTRLMMPGINHSFCLVFKGSWHLSYRINIFRIHTNTIKILLLMEAIIFFTQFREP